MTQRLKESYSHLGLPESVLNSVAKVAIIGLAEDVSDEDFDARVKDSSIEEMLKGFQSHADRVRGGKKVKEVKPLMVRISGEVKEEKDGKVVHKAVKFIEFTDYGRTFDYNA